MPRTLLFTGCVNQPLSYANPVSGKGIASYFVDEATGQAEPGPVYTGVVNPTFIALSADRTLLAAVTESEDRPADMLSLFAVNSTTGELTLLGQQSTQGTTACHCAFNAAGTMVATANYTAGSQPAGDAITVHRLVDGVPGPALTSIVHTGRGANARRQERSHAHYVGWTPDQRYVAVVDLGIDSVRLYRAADFSLASETKLPAGSGPRHLAFHPTKPMAYVMAELQPGVTTLGYAEGRLDVLATDPMQPAVPGGSAIVVAPTGTHLFVGDRGSKSIGRYDIDPATGIATFDRSIACGGDVPRDLAFTPSGAVLAVANVKSDGVALFRHTPDGDLAPLATIATGTPTAVAFA